ncbi:MAG: hypothetical protein PHU62_02300 [Bacteroidales bacterium]|nr:hypothetical protein [Bacteroidales bacterium]MDD2205225.1 hypothetical protein [Bacteroidales bacterium]MDD3151673.1 hypothetical protein [Bacteroidales bacterium]MDD3914676.1 hypothetical protein [Bacteroidales bacterium]MDD4633397.1 hypothetical protein [Bacteroidales bacterium]
MQTNKLSYINKEVEVPLNKSIFNRLLILNYLYGNEKLMLPTNAPDDVVLLYGLLQENIPEVCYCDNAGSVLRFILSVAALQNKGTLITGSSRMKQRPVKELVTMLKNLGSEIEYTENQGFPPVIIKKRLNLDKRILDIGATASSQFISSLMMIGGKLSNGLTINMKCKPPSYTYICMTASMMNKIGLPTSVTENQITVSHADEKIDIKNIDLEYDWSAAAFWYALLSCYNEGKIKIKNLYLSNLQGDCIISSYMKNYNIVTTAVEDGIIIEKKATGPKANNLWFNLIDTPDLAPAIAVAAAINNITTTLCGLENLKWKESDRFKLIISNLNSLGYKVEATSDNMITVYQNKNDLDKIENLTIITGNDHRIAMAFSIFEKINRNIKLDNYDCVSKSYPDFFDNINK